MNSRPAIPYLNPGIQWFLERLICLITRVLKLNGASMAWYVEAATNILDVLQDWLPLDAGHGYLHIETRGTGSLNIIVQDSTITISFVADLPFNLPMEPLAVFKLDGEGLVLGDIKKQQFILLLLRRATWARWEHNPNVKIEAEWTWTTDLRPSAKWVALRKEALEARMQPPRAEHWLADDPKDVTSA